MRVPRPRLRLPALLLRHSPRLSARLLFSSLFTCVCMQTKQRLQIMPRIRTDHLATSACRPVNACCASRGNRIRRCRKTYTLKHVLLTFTCTYLAIKAELDIVAYACIDRAQRSHTIPRETLSREQILVSSEPNTEIKMMGASKQFFYFYYVE